MIGIEMKLNIPVHCQMGQVTLWFVYPELSAV